MKILMVLEREFPPDDRVEKEISSLKNEGHEIHLACYTMEHRKSYEEREGYIVHRKPISKFIYKSSAACLILPFYFIFWRKYIKELYKKYKYDTIHIHDLPLTKIGVKFKKEFGLKLVCDQHEYYSNWIVYTAHYNTFLGKVVKLISYWKEYEKKYLKKADLVITVEEPLRQCYIKDVGISSENIIVVPNTPSREIFNKNNVRSSIVDKFKFFFVIYYVGMVDILRGIDSIICALPVLIKHIPNLKLIIAGKMVKTYNPFVVAKKLGVEKYVEFIGWLPIDAIPSYITASNICIFTPLVNRDEINNTIASKVYQYLVMGRPTIVGQANLMKEFIEKYEIGIIIKEDDPNDIAEKVINYYKDRKLQERLKSNCLKVSNQFFWEETVVDLINSYNSLNKV